MKTPAILLVETSLEGALAEESRRRTQLKTLLSMQHSSDIEFRLFYERIHDIAGLKHVLSRCVLQNQQLRTTTTKDGLESEKTDIRFVHISSHGSSDCPELPIKAGNNKTASERDFLKAFSVLRGSQIRALMFSACQVAQNGEFAKEIIETTGVKAVVGYPETAYDHVCAIAEQLLYFQLVRKKSIRVWDAVRRVNDALILLGERERRLLVCWSAEDGTFSGPTPWWEKDCGIMDRESRSFISSIRTLPKRGPLGEENLKWFRRILKII